MGDFILLMHRDAPSQPAPDQWSTYFTTLSDLGVFDGGSSIGAGEACRKGQPPGPDSVHLAGYIRIHAEDLAAAKALLAGNPVYECGGTVEVRELPRG